MSETNFPFSDVAESYQEYTKKGYFYALVSFDYEQVEKAHRVLLENFKIDVPLSYIVTMLATSVPIATELANDLLEDTAAIEKIAGYLARETVGRDYWPAYCDPQESREEFHVKFNEIATQRGWR